MRVFATSDLHTDYKENFLWLSELSNSAYRDDTLTVAGDVSDRLEIIRETLLLLRAKFRHVLFTPGNHELWARNESFDSIEKLRRVLSLCEEIGVTTRPLRLEDVWVVPLFSWYDGIFHTAEEERAAQKSWVDFHVCKWPEDAVPLPDYFLGMNAQHLKTYDGPVVAFSHFIPRSDLFAPKEYLRFSWLESISLCAALDRQIRTLKSHTHVCGHTHTTFDRVIDGVRYIQNAVRYPRERTTASMPIKQII